MSETVTTPEMIEGLRTAIADTKSIRDSLRENSPYDPECAAMIGMLESCLVIANGVHEDTQRFYRVLELATWIGDVVRDMQGNCGWDFEKFCRQMTDKGHIQGWQHLGKAVAEMAQITHPHEVPADACGLESA